MPDNSALLSILKTAVAILENVRAKIEQMKTPESGDKKKESCLHACEDALAAQLVTTAMRYHSTVAYEWQARVGGPLPWFARWMKRAVIFTQS
jgi:hypothetical protein